MAKTRQLQPPETNWSAIIVGTAGDERDKGKKRSTLSGVPDRVYDDNE